MREDDRFEPAVISEVETTVARSIAEALGGNVEVRGKTGSSITLKHTQKDGLVRSYVVKVKSKD